MLSNDEGYIIGVRKYKEKDSIIDVLTKNGVVTIFGKSYRNPKSKYHILNNVFLKIKMLGESKSTYFLKEYDILNYRYVNCFNLEDIQIISQVVKLVKKNENNDNEIYEMFEFMLENIKKHNIIHTKNNYIYYFICKILIKNKVNLNFNSCVRCNSKIEFKTFTIHEGGLICNKCYLGEAIKTVDDIKVIKSLFYGNIKDIEKIEISKEIKGEVEYLLNESLGLYT